VSQKPDPTTFWQDFIKKAQMSVIFDGDSTGNYSTSSKYLFAIASNKFNAVIITSRTDYTMHYVYKLQ